MKKLISAALIFGVLLSLSAVGVYANGAEEVELPVAALKRTRVSAAIKEGAVLKMGRAKSKRELERVLLDQLIELAERRSQWTIFTRSREEFERQLRLADKASEIKLELETMRTEGIHSYAKVAQLASSLSELDGMERVIGFYGAPVLELYLKYLVFVIDTYTLSRPQEQDKSEPAKKLWVTLNAGLYKITRSGEYTFEDLIEPAKALDEIIWQ